MAERNDRPQRARRPKKKVCMFCVDKGDTDEQLVAAGIDGGMIRFSCGLENVEDILADIDQALEKLD